MDRHKLEILIRQPGEMNGSEVEMLKQYLQRYPYCQSFHLLQTRAMHLSRDIGYREKLRESAAYVGSRVRLKQLVMSDCFRGKVAPEPVYELPLIPVVAYNIEKAYPPTVDSGMLSTVADRKISEKADLLSDTERMQLIGQIQDRLNEIKGGKVEDKSKSFPIDSSEMKKDHSGVPSKFDLIDKFIRNEPRIIPRHDTPETESVAQKNEVVQDDFVSETLAKIYAAQGNIGKAVRIYSKLSLKFPEKSHYFANLINEVKKSNNI